jgi:hypothetical protein
VLAPPELIDRVQRIADRLQRAACSHPASADV